MSILPNMKCPHCSNSISLLVLLGQSMQSVGRRSFEDKLCCTSCRNRIYYSIRPVMVFLGLLIAMFGFFNFGRALLEIFRYGISSYIIISLFMIGAISIRLQKNPNNLSVVRQSLIHSINFTLFSTMIPILVIQIGFFYYNLIPAEDSLIEVEGTIMDIAFCKDGLPEFIVLKEQGPTKRYYLSIDRQLMKEWRLLQFIGFFLT